VLYLNAFDVNWTFRSDCLQLTEHDRLENRIGDHTVRAGIARVQPKVQGQTGDRFDAEDSSVGGQR
jgi:hypothetical protein